MNSAANKKVRLFSMALLLIAACGLAARQTAWAACSHEQIFEMIVEDRSTAQISRECGDPQARRLPQDRPARFFLRQCRQRASG